jgi:hypothetical protein
LSSNTKSVLFAKKKEDPSSVFSDSLVNKMVFPLLFLPKEIFSDLGVHLQLLKVLSVFPKKTEK